MSKPDEFWKNKAEALKKSGKFEEALKAYDKASKIEDSKEKSDSWYQQACSYSEIGDYEKAMECLENEIKFNQPSFQTLFEKGIILCLSKKYAEAVELFNKAYESTYDEFLESSNQAEKLKEHRKFEKAVLVSDKAMNVNPIPEKFWYYKGVALLGQEKFDESLECFITAEKNGLKDAELFYDMAKCQLMTGKNDEALETLEKACAINSGFRKILSIDPIFEKLKQNQKFRQIRDFNMIEHS